MGTKKSTDAAYEIYRTNDASLMDDVKREEKLKKLFAEQDIEIKFED